MLIQEIYCCLFGLCTWSLLFQTSSHLKTTKTSPKNARELTWTTRDFGLHCMLSTFLKLWLGCGHLLLCQIRLILTVIGSKLNQKLMDNIFFSAYSGVISVVSMLLADMSFCIKEKPSTSLLVLGLTPSLCILISLMNISKVIIRMFRPLRIQQRLERTNHFGLLSQDQLLGVTSTHGIEK